MIKSFWATSLLLLSSLACAQNSPVGLWRSVDDGTGEAKAEIRIVSEPSGQLTGRIDKALVQKGSPNCNVCTDDRKDKPVVGLDIIRGVRKTEGKDVWENGRILDPENGKEYTVRLTPLEGGKQLQVRGYIGVFYRTQVWQRIE
ncbi:DUF2147 domain-containing protein [Curvibacter sp. RS43]|uniref:DUF2147 domain-containing protein n=1 Tax=Curvibacter microcysteis TaxID=3026419 RepID=A0ABT5MIE0_9BURK|nr:MULTISPECIES: DUF2147 domain-containing protein [unclassified Curvibacter]MDD0810514.1 DUF2147 domain-containing protein [Curvibacter sp. RS43]MDD0815749.1 DUF2147 domain-containing protein [Curvibacter sp. HBC28]